MKFGQKQRREKPKNDFKPFSETFIYLLIFSMVILSVNLASAAWYNPFSWFDGHGDYSVEKETGKWVEIFSDNPDFHVVIPENSKHGADIYLCSYSATKKKDLKDLDFGTSDWKNGKNLETKEKLKAIEYNGEFCYYYKPSSNEKFLKFDKHSTHLIYTTESITAYEDTSELFGNPVEIGSLSLSTENFNYKNGKPNTQIGYGNQILTHTFYVENWTNESITNLRTINMKSNEEVERNAVLKFLTYENIEVPTYEEVCTVSENLTEVCEFIQNGTKAIQKKNWITKDEAIENENYVVGIFADVKRDDYVDIDFDYYGISVLKSPIDWATWEADWSVGNVFYLPLNETSGNAIDNTGNGYDFSVYGGVTQDVTGYIGQGYDFNRGSSGYLLDNIGTAMSYPDAFTISFWWNIDYSTSSPENWGLWGFDGLTNGMYAVNSQSVRFYLEAGASELIDESLSSSEVNGKWIWSVYRWDGTNGYLDIYNETAKLGDWDDSPSNMDYPTNNLYFGSYGDTQRDFDGQMDEISLWNRSLSDEEIDDLWENYLAGLGFLENLNSDNPPEITLVSPTNESNLTQSSYIFQATITDDKYIQNASLYIDGVLEDTDTSHTNGTYYFTGSYSEGYHNWSVIAYDNSSQSTTSDTWFFNYTQPPIYINLNSPDDSYTSEIPLVNFNCNASEAEGVEELNLIIDGDVNYTVTNSTPAENLTLDVSYNMSEGNYTWTCNATNPSTSAQSNSRDLEVLYSSPEVNLTYPNNYANLTTADINFTAFINDTNGIANVSLYLDGVLNYTDSSEVEGNYKFIKYGFSDGNHNWYIKAYSKLGKLTTSETRTFNIDTSSPTIEITSPESIYDYLYDGKELYLNYSISDDNLGSCWYFYEPEMDFTRIGGAILELSTNSTGNDIYVQNNDCLGVPGACSGIIGSILIAPYTFNVSDVENGLCLYNDDSEVGADLNAVDYLCAYNSTVTYIIKSDATTTANLYSWVEYDNNYLNCSADYDTFEYVLNNNEVTVYANDTFGNINYSTIEFYYKVYENYRSYNTTTYETDSETYTINVNSNESLDNIYVVFDWATKEMTYNGNGIWTYVGDIPADYIVNSSFTFEFDYSGETFESTIDSYQDIQEIYFGICNATYSNDFLNITFSDQDDLSVINASIPISTFDYYLGGGDYSKEYEYNSINDSYEYGFCASPINRTFNVIPYVQYKQDPNYPQVVWSPAVQEYTSSVTEQVLYLLSSTDGIYVTLQVINSADQVLSGVEITITRRVDGESVIVGAGTTGDSGTATFWLNPDFEHDFTFAKDGYDDYDTTFAPTQSSYTITMGGGVTEANAKIRGIDYKIYPTDTFLVNDTTYLFGVRLNSSYYDVDEYGFNLRLPNGTTITGDSTTIENTLASISYNVNNLTAIYIDIYWDIDGEINYVTRSWAIQNTEYSGYGIKTFFSDFSLYVNSESGIFGLDDFGIKLIVFFIIFISVGIFSMKYGVSSPIAVSGLIFSVIYFFDVVVEIIPTIRGISNLPTFISGLILALVILNEVRTR